MIKYSSGTNTCSDSVDKQSCIIIQTGDRLLGCDWVKPQYGLPPSAFHLCNNAFWRTDVNVHTAQRAKGQSKKARCFNHLTRSFNLARR